MSVVDHSGTITTGGVAQTVFTLGQAPHGFTFQNISTAGMYIRDDGGTASAGAGSIYVAPNSLYESPRDSGPVTALSVFCATTSSAFTCQVY